MALRKRRREARVGRPKVVCATVRALVFVPRVGSVACVILPQVRPRGRVRSQLAYALRKTRLYAALTAPSNPAASFPSEESRFGCVALFEAGASMRADTNN